MALTDLKCGGTCKEGPDGLPSPDQSSGAGLVRKMSGGGEQVPSLQAMAKIPSNTQPVAGMWRRPLLKYWWLQSLMISDAGGLNLFLGSLPPTSLPSEASHAGSWILRHTRGLCWRGCCSPPLWGQATPLYGGCGLFHFEVFCLFETLGSPPAGPLLSCSVSFSLFLGMVGVGLHNCLCVKCNPSLLCGSLFLHLGPLPLFHSWR